MYKAWGRDERTKKRCQPYNHNRARTTGGRGRFRGEAQRMSLGLALVLNKTKVPHKLNCSHCGTYFNTASSYTYLKDALQTPNAQGILATARLHFTLFLPSFSLSLLVIVLWFGKTKRIELLVPRDFSRVFWGQACNPCTEKCKVRRNDDLHEGKGQEQKSVSDGLHLRWKRQLCMIAPRLHTCLSCFSPRFCLSPDVSFTYSGFILLTYRIVQFKPSVPRDNNT